MPAKNPDGGFYYTPAAGGESEAGKTPNGGLRSYASMTYAGLKSMIYAGVGPDDPRVKAAVKWFQMHYGLDDNPGMGGAGLYYYYHTFAKALDAAGLKTIQGRQGRRARLAGATSWPSWSGGSAPTAPGSTTIPSGWKASRAS